MSSSSFGTSSASHSASSSSAPSESSRGSTGRVLTHARDGEILEERKEADFQHRRQTAGNEARKGETVYTDDHLRKTACPRCDGLGWKHQTSHRHDKHPRVKCRHCTPCKACNSSGSVHGKRACVSCSTLGFVHAHDAERTHDVPRELRCFFCRDCEQCGSLGVVDSEEVVRVEERRRREREREERRARREWEREERRRLRREERERELLEAELADQEEKDRYMMMMMILMLQQQLAAANANNVGAPSMGQAHQPIQGMRQVGVHQPMLGMLPGGAMGLVPGPQALGMGLGMGLSPHGMSFGSDIGSVVPSTPMMVYNPTPSLMNYNPPSTPMMGYNPNLSSMMGIMASPAPSLIDVPPSPMLSMPGGLCMPCPSMMPPLGMPGAGTGLQDAMVSNPSMMGAGGQDVNMRELERMFSALTGMGGPAAPETPVGALQREVALREVWG
ncbi:hypothetical protein HK101_004709 [Irineochytrium annulatum]|nr:hypothetical protein HK101_004709 [Irineochytrium annulatum]